MVVTCCVLTHAVTHTTQRKDVQFFESEETQEKAWELLVIVCMLSRYAWCTFHPQLMRETKRSNKNRCRKEQLPRKQDNSNRKCVVHVLLFILI